MVVVAAWTIVWPDMVNQALRPGPSCVAVVDRETRRRRGQSNAGDCFSVVGEEQMVLKRPRGNES